MERRPAASSRSGNVPAVSDPSTPSVEEVLHAAVGNLGGEDRPGQVEMAQAVREAMRRRRAPARPGRHRHRQVARLPRPGRAPRRARRRRHGHARPAAPARRSATSRPCSTPPPRSSASSRSTPSSRAGQQLRVPAPDPRRRTRRPGHPGRPPGGRSAARSSGCASGPSRSPRRAAPVTATAHRRTPTGSGSRSRSTTGSASAPTSARTPSSASPSGPASGRCSPSSIVTNHSLLAIDAIEGVPMIPEYDVVVVDEAHELVVAGHPGGHRRALDPGDRASRPSGAQLPRRLARPTTCRRG